MDFSHVIFNFQLQLGFLIFIASNEQLINEKLFTTDLNIKNCCNRYYVNMKDNLLNRIPDFCVCSANPVCVHTTIHIALEKK